MKKSTLVVCFTALLCASDAVCMMEREPIDNFAVGNQHYLYEILGKADRDMGRDQYASAIDRLEPLFAGENPPINMLHNNEKTFATCLMAHALYCSEDYVRAVPYFDYVLERHLLQYVGHFREGFADGLVDVGYHQSESYVQNLQLETPQERSTRLLRCERFSKAHFLAIAGESYNNAGFYNKAIACLKPFFVKNEGRCLADDLGSVGNEVFAIDSLVESYLAMGRRPAALDYVRTNRTRIIDALASTDINREDITSDRGFTEETKNILLWMFDLHPQRHQ